MPNLIEIQKKSYEWFLSEGLSEAFDDISPISDYNGNLSLEFVDFKLCTDEVKYSIEECKERDATYAAPLKVKVNLINHDTETIREHTIFLGDMPLMRIGLPAVLSVYFDVFSGVMQAFIFAMLTMLNVAGAVPWDDWNARRRKHHKPEIQNTAA